MSFYKGLSLFRAGRGTRRRASDALSANTFTLVLATVAIGTSGHAVAGLMPDMAARLHAAPAMVGQLAALFALTCALMGPLLVVATGGWRRRTLLVAALTVTGLGNAMAALAPNFVWLSVARVVTALGAATATAVAVGVAIELNAPRARGRAIGYVLCGLAVALTLGVPGAHAVAAAVGYAPVLAGVAVLCWVAAGLVRALVPAEAPDPASATETGTGDRRVTRVLLASGLLWMSTFVVYPYLTVLLAAYSGGHGLVVSLLLAAYGIGAMMGTVIGGALTDAWGPRPPLIVAAAVTGLAVLILVPTVDSVAGPVIALAVWGAAGWSTPSPINAWLIELAPGRARVVLSLAGSTIYAGMAAGGVLGGLVLAAFGPAALPPVAATIAAVACALLDRAGRPRRRRRIREDRLPSARPPTPLGARLIGRWMR